MTYSSRLLEGFQELSRLVLSHETVESTLDVVSRLAVQTIPACDVASVSLIESGSVSTVGSSDAVAFALDAVQYETGQGPCLDVIRKEAMWFQIDEMSKDEQWPDFSARATQLGFESLLAFPLRVDSETLGALNLYAQGKMAFAQEDRDYGAIYAAHAAVALINAQLWADKGNDGRHLDDIVVTREIIGRAVGILMEGEARSAEEALAVLEARAAEMKGKLLDIAQVVIVDADARRAAMELPPGFADRLLRRTQG
ncbi:MAG TPA: GAF and ANTAR domain-containing protein [Actinomycetota bacterium]|nr:GAF and ANTAR domain-containing protein [Actinomycetota bacterium]